MDLAPSEFIKSVSTVYINILSVLFDNGILVTVVYLAWHWIDKCSYAIGSSVIPIKIYYIKSFCNTFDSIFISVICGRIDNK